jgi:hypothetical protein
MKPPKAVRDYMASLGSKGGGAKGKSKARDPEHYKRLADMKRAKPCTDGGDHDWRYASHAPGWKLGDKCVICQRCKRRKVWTGKELN